MFNTKEMHELIFLWHFLSFVCNLHYDNDKNKEILQSFLQNKQNQLSFKKQNQLSFKKQNQLKFKKQF